MKFVKLLVRNPVNYPDYLEVIQGDIRRVDGGFVFRISKPVGGAEHSFVPDSNVREAIFVEEEDIPALPVVKHVENVIGALKDAEKRRTRGQGRKK